MIANPTLMIERERRRPIPSKQATLDLFQTLAGERLEQIERRLFARDWPSALALDHQRRVGNHRR